MASSLRALRSSNYRLYFLGQLVSMTGTWMQSTAQAWMVYRLSHSALWLGIISFSSLLPAFLASPLAGVLVDLRERRSVLIWVEVVAMLQAFFLAAPVLYHR